MSTSQEPRIVLLSEFLDLIILEFDRGIIYFSKAPYSYHEDVMEELYDIYQRIEVLYFKLISEPIGQIGFRYHDMKDDEDDVKISPGVKYFSPMRSLIHELHQAYLAYVEEFDTVPNYLMLTLDLYARLEAELEATEQIHRPWIDDIIILEMANSNGWMYVKK